VDPAKLERASSLGARWTFNPRESDARSIKKRLLAESGVVTARWRILEMSGPPPARSWLDLLASSATLGVIGFTMDKPDIRLSNLMALDATASAAGGAASSLSGCR